MESRLRVVVAAAAALFVGLTTTGALAANRGQIFSGETRSTSLAAGTTDVWTISYTAGTAVVLKAAPPLPAPERLSVVVRDAGGNQRKTIACTGGTTVSDQFTLPATGTYTVTLAGCNGFSGAYSLSFLNATAGPLRVSGDPAVEGGLLFSGRTIRGTLGTSDIDAYQLRGDVGERVVFNTGEASTGGPKLRIGLYPPPGAPSSTTPLFYGNQDQQEITLTHAGTYTLVVLGQDLNSAGDYYLTLQKLPGASADCYSALPDTDGGIIPAAPTAEVGGSIVRPTDLDAWQFHAAAGQTATVTLSREMRLALYAPQVPRGYDLPVYSYACGLAQQAHAVVLPASGYYELLVEDCAAAASGAYTVTLELPAETAAPPMGAPTPGECAVVTNVFDPAILGWNADPAATDYEVLIQQQPAGAGQSAGTVEQPAGVRAAFPIPRTLATGSVYAWHVAARDVTPAAFDYSPAYTFGLLCTPAVSVAPASVAFGDVLVGQTAAPVTVTIANTGTCTEDPRVASVPAGFRVLADTCSGAPAGGHLAPGASCSFQVEFAPDAHGPFAGGLVLDGLLSEAHGGVFNLSGRGVLPDLRVASIVDPQPPVGGNYVVTTDTTENDGDGPAPASNLTYRLSLDTALDAGDLTPTAGARATPPLVGGASSTGSVDLYLPPSIPSGSWHIAICVDQAGLIEESDETNNCTVSPGTFQVGRDVSVAEVTDAPVLSPDGTFSFTETTRNLGTMPAPATVTGYRLSLDQKITRLDPVLTLTRDVPALPPYPDAAHVSTATVTLTVPAETPAGSYYVAACADATNVLAESSETNNCRLSKSPIGVEPDLAVTALSEPPASPFVGYAGATLTVTDTTANTGVNAAAASVTTYRLSLDATITASDPLLTGNRAVPPLGVGAVSTGTVTVTVPATMPEGDFYLGACADDTRLVSEGNEANNCRVSTGKITIARADLAATAVSNPPAAAATGGTFSVTDTTRNAGPAPSLASATSYRLSLDADVTLSDPVLTGTRAVAVLAVGESSSGTVTVTIPAKVAPGTYYLGACADGLGAVSETNENNNCISSGTTVAVAAPDLRVSVLTDPPAGGTPGTVFSVTDTTQNLSATTGAAASSTRYRLSADLTVTATDPLLTGSRAVRALAAGESLAGTVNVTIPATVAPNTYHLVACADDLRAVAETDETNNCFVTTAVIVVQKADLTLSALSEPPAAGLVGDSFPVNDTVANAGPAAAGVSTTRFYLSADTTISAADPLLSGTRAVPALAAAASSAGTGTAVTIPGTVPQGTYYLGACADGGGAVSESNEQNNCRASAGRITVSKPDLAAVSISEPPTELDPGAGFAITDAVRNAGVVSAAASTTRYRLSLDQTITATDPLLAGSRAVPALAAGVSSSGTVTVTLPLTVAQGSYFVAACADAEELVSETDETNNCAVSAGTLDVLNADLRVSALGNPPAEAFVGTSFDVADTTVNAGGAATTAETVTRYRLSTDTTITSADLLLPETSAAARHTIAALGPGESSEATINVTVPGTIPDGTYYLAACADFLAVVTESNETNNCRVSTSTVELKKADLVVAALGNPPAEGFVGSIFDVADTTENSGIAPAGASITRYRLSADGVITASDPLLAGTRDVAALGAGAVSAGTATVTIPATIANGVYYLGACADDGAAVWESNEANNCRVSATTIELKKPDLVVSALSDPPSTGLPGTVFSVTDTVENTGPAPAGSTTTRYRLSLDGVATTADPLLTGTRLPGALAAGASATGTVNLTIPASVAPGSYRLAACADDLRAVSESNESNNCTLTTATIDLRKADLLVSAVSNPPANGTVGLSFTVTDTTENAGNTAAAATATQYRLSTDVSITTADPQLTGTRSVGALAPGTSSNGSVTVTIPGTIAPGVYYLGACADGGSAVPESNENNNCAVSGTTVNLEKADLRVLAVSNPSAETTVGGQIVLTDTTENAGAVAADASTTRFRISADPTISSADQPLAEVGARHAIAALAPGATSQASIAVTIPSVAQGLYYIGACADDDGTVSETNETNNCTVAPGTIMVKRPDLTVTAVSDPPAEGFVGSTFNLTDTTANGGIAPSGASTTRYRLSPDASITSADVVLSGTRAVAALAIGAVSTGTVAVSIPTGLNEGTYYLAACADDQAVIPESNEANNCLLAAGMIELKKADLRVAAVSDPPAEGFAGTSFSITDTTENRPGALAAAGASITRYHLSLDATITAADPVLTGSRAVPALAAGESSSGSASLSLPATLAQGTYYLAACADDTAAVSESDEANNCLVAAGRIFVKRPDLRATAVSEPPAGGLVGGTFSVTDTTENAATALAPAGASTTRYRLSADTNITTADVLLTGQRSVPALAIGAASTGAQTVTIPASVGQGAFYLAACADAMSAVAESNETNNCVVSTGTIRIDKPDLAVSAVTSPPAEGYPGAVFDVTDTTLNLAGALTGAGASTTRYRLSTDATISAADALLTGSRSVGALGVGEQSQGTVSVTIPGGLAQGTYYFGACADDTAVVSEASETNNCLAADGTIVIRLPDLTVTAVSDPPSLATAGDILVLGDTTANVGLAPAVPSGTVYRLSLDTTVTTADPLLTGNRALGTIAVGGSSSGSGPVTVPTGIPEGTYHLAACADGAGNAVTEIDETNNCLLAAGTIEIRLSDLTVTAVDDPPALGNVGDSLSVTDTTANIGPAAAGSSVTRYRLSLDTTITTGDSLLTGSRAVGGLAGGASSSGSATVTIPPGLAEGFYYLAACADAAAQVGERNESNNCTVSAGTVNLWKPDLAVTALSAPPAEAVPGLTAFDVTDTTANLSAQRQAPASITRYYLSTTQTQGGSIAQLTGERAIPALAADAGSTGTVSVAVPGFVVEGLYWLLACADAGGAVSETNETNCAASATQVQVRKSDLTVPQVGNPPPVSFVGGSFAVSDTTRNAGTIDAPATTTIYRLSRDLLVTTADPLLFGSREVPALAPGAESSGSVTVMIPLVSAGLYYLVACADGGSAVAEGSEANNCRASGTTVDVRTSGPDLVVEPVPGGDAYQSPGLWNSERITVTNRGRAAAGASATHFFWSLDTVVDAGDYPLIGTQAVPSLGVNASFTSDVYPVNPLDVPEGVYYFIVCADYADAVPEVLENNNCVVASQTTMRWAELRLTDVSGFPATVNADSHFSVTDTTANVAAPGGDAPTFTNAYYLSADAVLDAGDTLLAGGRTILGEFIAPITSTGSATVTVPGGVAPGVYHVAACADATGAVTEANENDNCFVSAATIEVLPPLADLLVTAISAIPNLGDVYAPFDLTGTTRNTATVVGAAATTTSYYLSRDWVLGGGDDYLLATRAVPALAPGATFDTTVTITVPQSAPAGHYRMLVCADHLGEVTEADEANNCRTSGNVIVIESHPDLVNSFAGAVVQVLLPYSAGMTFPVDNRTENIGNIFAIDTVTRLRFSADTTITAADPLLGSIAVPALSAGEAHLGTATLTVPAIPAGYYYLGACSDDNGSVAELSEANNCSIYPTMLQVQ